MKAAIVIALSLISCILFGRDSANASTYLPGEILVKYRGASQGAALNSLHGPVRALQKKGFAKINVKRVKLADNVSVEEGIERYMQDPDVEYAEPNYIVRAHAPSQVFPDDPFFSTRLWGLHNGSSDADIDAPEAWGLTTGSDSVVIAVIDSGIAVDHPDLKTNIWINSGETDCGNAIDDDLNGYVDDCNGWDFLNDDNDPNDFFGHGTHVAGTIAAQGNNSTGITGVMWQAEIMALRFLGIHGSGTTADAIAAILYADANGADIINLSWGGTGFSQALKDTIDATSAVVVCSAGNEGLNSDVFPSYPASYSSPNILSVAATDQDDILRAFSNYGSVTVQ